MSRQEHFGIGAAYDPPVVNTTITPPREWTTRPGFNQRHVSDDLPAGQGYLFRARTDSEKWKDEQAERGRVNTELANRDSYVKDRHAATFHQYPLSNALPAQHWPKPVMSAQHGEYTLGAVPGHAYGIAAFHGDRPVGRLQIAHDDQMTRKPYVGFLETAPEHRGKGIARAMWNLGRQFTDLHHSASRTHAGEAFAQSVGGPQMYGRDIVPKGKRAP